MNFADVKKLVLLNMDNYPGRFLSNSTPEQVNTIIATWHKLFANEETGMVITAYLEALKFCPFPVTPADIFSRLHTVEEAMAPSIEAEWQALIQAADYCHYQSSGFDYTGPSRKYEGLTQGQERLRDCTAKLESLSELNREFTGNIRRLIELGRLEERDQNFFYIQRYKPFLENYRERKYALKAFPQLAKLSAEGNQQLEAANE